MTGSKGKFGIVASGGPAPGINTVISAATIEAINSGYKVIGLKDGFRGASGTDKSNFMELTTGQVSLITSSGGSILGTSRFNPFRDPKTQEQLLTNLKELEIDKLVVIGGEGSAYLSYTLSRLYEDVSIVHVPKTIDNDLVLPNNHPSFGFETARYVGSRTLETLRADAKTCNRWYLAVTMGRQAGFLALGIGITSGATLTLIPEEFADRLYSPDEIATIIFHSIERRYQQGKPFGTAILAEGILDRLDPDSAEELADCVRDDLGRITYSEIELGELIVPRLKKMCQEKSIPIAVRTKNIGYELRCAKPVAFDVEYTKFLGYGAVRHILDGKRNIMVTRDHDNIGFQDLDSLVEDGKILARTVDLTSDFYLVGRSYMIR